MLRPTSINLKIECDVKALELQITKFIGENMDLITVYRSQGAAFGDVVTYLEDLVNVGKNTLIVGDLSYCYMEDRNDLSRFVFLTFKFF